MLHKNCQVNMFIRRHGIEKANPAKDIDRSKAQHQYYNADDGVQHQSDDAVTSAGNSLITCPGFRYLTLSPQTAN